MIVRGLAVAVLGAVAAVPAVGAQAGTAKPQLASIQRAAAAPIGGANLGAPASGATQTGFVVLKPRDPQALASFVGDVTTPHSAHYRDFLKAGQFAGRFGAGGAAIAAVESQLAGAGVQVTSVNRDGMLIGVSGTTANVETAFGTRLERYRSAAGITGEQTTRAISLPSSIASDVSAVIGLNTLVRPEADLVHPARTAYAGHPAAATAQFAHPAGAPNPCGSASAVANQFGGLTNDQIANAYGATPLYGAGDTGQGVSIGVYELEPYSSSDLQTFDECYFGQTAGASMAAGVHTINVDGGQPAGPGSGESILDIQDVSALAPGANIDVYQAPNTSAGSLDEYAQMVNDDRDQIITSSWGLCEQDLQLADPGAQQAEYYIFEQAAAQGQTVLNAAGDEGNDTCNEVRNVPPPSDQNPLSVGDPASQPYVLGVGGTTIQNADPSNYNETVWNDGAQWGGGGGGISESWAAPSWQQSLAYFSGGQYSTDLGNATAFENGAISAGVSNFDLTPNFCTDSAGANLPTGTLCRGVPDVSAQADEFTGAVTIYVGSQGGWTTIGGTSSATPIWAAMLALVDGSSACVNHGVTDIGFASPLLYAVAQNPTGYAASFHDVTAGNNDVFGFQNGQVFPARTGYDLASGLGSPILAGSDGAPGLANYLCDLAVGASPKPTVTGLSPSFGPVAGTNSVEVTGSGFKPGGVSAVSAVTIGADTIKLPNAAIVVNSDSQLTITMPAGSATLAPTQTSSTDPNTNVTFNTGGAATGQDGAGLANVVVTLTDGSSSAVFPNDTIHSLYDQYSYVDEDGSSRAQPSVSSVSPYAGVQTGGTPITIYGSGFATGDTVTVGGNPATPVTVVSPWEIKTTTPAYPNSNSACVTESALVSELSSLSGDTNPKADNICQTEVVITDPSTTDSSAVTPPVRTYLGVLPASNQNGLLEVPSGYELSPVPDEFDYIPAPALTSVQPLSLSGLADADPGATPTTYGSPTATQIDGQGLNYQTLNWFSIGDPSTTASQDTTLPLYADGTKVLLNAPSSPTVVSGGTLGTAAEPTPVVAVTLAGSSTDDSHCAIVAQDCVVYAGVPTISGLSGNVSSATIPSAAPDSGGTNLAIIGQGLSQVSGPLKFIDAVAPPVGVPPFSIGTQYSYTVLSDNEIATQTVQQNPALVDTLACSESGCSALSSHDQLLLYPPGDPVITSVQPSSGPALGGTLVTINGENLGCVRSVTFGSANYAMAISNTAAILDCGSTNQVQVIAPAGGLGSSVPITLTTVESDVAGPTHAASLVSAFTYDTANPIVPSSVSFGSVDVGSSSTQSVTITNPSTATQPLYPGPGWGGSARPAYLTAGDPANFSILNDACSRRTLNPGQSCTIQLSFAPTSLGSLSTVLDIPWNNSAGVDAASATPDFRVELSGTGSEPLNTVTVPSVVTIPGATTTVTVPVTVPGPGTTTTVTERVTCRITIRWKWVTVRVHGRRRRERRKVTTRSSGCKPATKPSRKHGSKHRPTKGRTHRRHR